MTKRVFFKKVGNIIVPPLAAMLMKLIHVSNKKIYHHSTELPKTPIVFLFWHNDILMEPFQYLKRRAKHNIKLVISDHYDGIMIAKAMRYYRFGNIAGSSNSNPTKVMIQAMRFLKEGGDIGMTPDGPRGPRYSISKGTVIMAQKTQSPIVVFSSKASKYWKIKSWDKFVVPKLFGTIDYYASEPIDVVGLSYEEAETKVKEVMMRYAYE